MNEKKVTINGKEYPVVFNIKTMLNYEGITGTSFFREKFDKLKERMVLVLAAALSADENTTLTLADLTERDSWKAIQEVIAAFAVAMQLAEEFFEIPAVVAAAEPQPTEKEEQEDSVKN